jgi:hypothetical protein
MGKKNSEPGTVDKPHLVTKFNPKWMVQVFQPLSYDEKADRLFKDILKEKHTYVHIDDTGGLCTASSVPDGIQRVWTQGRALNVGGSVGAQTYNKIPTIFRSQAEKFYVFQVGKDDIKDAADLVNVVYEEVENLGEYEHIYYDTKKMQTGLWMPPLAVTKELTKSNHEDNAMRRP